MAEELSYILITPYSIKKSRTGGIIGRLISRSGLELVAGRMFAPSRELIERYAEHIVTEKDAQHRKTQEMIRDYVVKSFSPDSKGRPSRVMMLVLRGEDAVKRVLEVAGHIVNECTSGETIRDTFGDYVADQNGEVRYFEPAVIAPPNAEAARKDLQLWASFSDKDGGILEKVIEYPVGSTVQRTLVLIKPDNFRFPNLRPGGVIDVFSRTGLSIIGFKVHNMSVAEAEEFYGPVLPVLQDKLKEPSAKRARAVVERELDVALDSEAERKLGEILGPIVGRSNWESIVQFMAGIRPSDCSKGARNSPGSEKCVALVYQGIDAVRKIRDVLGPTDPSKAPTGSIRREFGQTIMVNAAHASDSAENAEREMGLLKIGENNLKAVIESHFGAA